VKKLREDPKRHGTERSIQENLNICKYLIVYGANMSPNCSLSSPLSQSQKAVWSLINKGFSVSSIADRLNTTRQYVNQTRLTAEAKLSTTLLEVARANDLQVTRLDPKEAILLGYHPALKRKAVVTYSTNHGIKVWYWHDNPEEITNEDFLRQTREYLLDIAKERGVQVEDAKIHPAKLAHAIFSKLVPEVKA
jgi:DNA-binding CsgD family transcriptional regulator